MIDLNGASLNNCILHKVGNKTNGGDIKLSSREMALDDDLQFQLSQYFFKPFKNMGETHRFTHQMNLDMNEAFASVSNILAQQDFIQHSKHIAQHLFEQTRHPAVKHGELLVAYINDIKYGDGMYKGVGIFKSEKKDSFFKVTEDGKRLGLLIDEGINQQKLDKGCIVLEHAQEDGFVVLTFEQGGADTDYWRDDFLSIKPREDEFYLTRNYLGICKDYIVDKLPNEFEISRAEQIDILNKSVNYFKNNEDFNEKDFVKTVFDEPGMRKAFNNFKTERVEEEGIAMEDNFHISDNAVKKQARVFKSVLKLDKNFHVYVHGNREMIERGFDKEKGMNFYKIYFKEES